METLKKILTIIVNPFHRYGSRGVTDAITKNINKKPYINVIIAFVILVIVIVLAYFVF